MPIQKNEIIISVCSTDNCEKPKQPVEILDAERARIAAEEASKIASSLKVIDSMGRITKGGNYFDKYMKYKNKYLKLKSQM
jgi:hypothetical protein